MPLVGIQSGGQIIMPLDLLCNKMTDTFFGQGFPILSARPHPAPFFVSVPCRAPPDTAHSPFFSGVGRPSQREAGENWKALLFWPIFLTTGKGNAMIAHVQGRLAQLAPALP